MKPFQTLQFRLTASFVIIFCLLQVILWIAVDSLLKRHLHERFDIELLHRGRNTLSTIEAAEAPALEATPAAVLEPIVESFESDNLFVQITLVKSRSVIQSRNLLGFGFPLPETNGKTEGKPHFRTIRDELATALVGDGHEIRLLTLYSDSTHLGPFYLQVAGSLQPLERTVVDIQRLLVLFIAISVLAAGVTSWIAAQHSLGPIATITENVKHVSLAEMDQRIPVPKARDEVYDLIVTVNDLFDRLKGVFTNQQRFISQIAHELRTPLAVLSAAVQFQQRGRGNSEEWKEFLQIADEEVRRMRRMIESFLILSRAKSAQRLEIAADVAIEDIVVQAIASVHASAKARAVQIVPTFISDDDTGGPVVAGDSDLLISMIENLLRNAARYSSPGQSVEVDVTASSHGVTISVRDRGPGIPVHQIEHIFDLFYQVDPKSEQTGKAGVGLAIVKAVAELHGGAVQVQNRNGGGCEFTVRIPFSRLA